jgi:hypothetical protein
MKSGKKKPRPKPIPEKQPITKPGKSQAAIPVPAALER